MDKHILFFLSLSVSSFAWGEVHFARRPQETGRLPNPKNAFPLSLQSCRCRCRHCSPKNRLLAAGRRRSLRVIARFPRVNHRRPRIRVLSSCLFLAPPIFVWRLIAARPPSPNEKFVFFLDSALDFASPAPLPPAGAVDEPTVMSS